MKTIVIVGFGNIGQAIQPLLKKEYPEYKIIAFDKEIDESRRTIAQDMAIELHHACVTQHNYCSLLSEFLVDGSYLLNLAVEVSTIDLISLAQEKNAFYVDAGVEPWAYTDDEHTTMTSNYALREQVLAFAAQPEQQQRRTAIIAQGANPGFVSVLVKCALEKMAHTYLPELCNQTLRPSDWPLLAERLGIRVIQISECDTQVSHVRAQPGEFVNTWSVDGLITEALQCAEAGWGSHEQSLPAGAQTHEDGCQAAVIFDRPGVNLKMRSWSPNRLEFESYLITHNESISIADFLTIKQDKTLRYRPTVYFAYRPCDETVAAMRLIEHGNSEQVLARRVVKDDVISGMDELGVFLLSDHYPSIWFGSNLSIGRTRAIAKYNNATSLQVVSSIVGAMKWANEHADLGIIESEQIDHRFMYDFVAPYWGPMLYEQTTWRPATAPNNLQFSAFLAQPVCSLQEV